MFEILALFMSATLGYALGMLRDSAKAKADQEARHRDEVLAASAHILASAVTIQDASDRHSNALAAIAEQREEIEPRESPIWAEVNAELDRIRQARIDAYPSIMKMRVITPELYPLVQNVMNPPWSKRRLEGPSPNEHDWVAYRAQSTGDPEAAMAALATGVTEYLNGSSAGLKQAARWSTHWPFRRRKPTP